MNVKNKIFHVLISLFVIMFPLVSDARPDEFSGDIFDIPKSLYISEVTTNIEDIGVGDTLQGQINILSNEDTVVADYKLSFELRQTKQSDQISIDRIDQANLINIQHDPRKLVIKPNTSTIESISYSMPQFLPEGDYYLRVLLRNPESTTVDAYVVPVGYLSGPGFSKNPFVAISKASIERRPDNTDWSLNIGISSNNEESLFLKGEAILSGETQSLEVSPKLVVYERAAGEKVVYESQDLDAIKLEKGATQPFEIAVPKLDIAGSYFAELLFEKDGQSISNVIDFHWVVSGESGRIINLTINKTNFNKGDEAIVDMQLSDRADLHFSEGEIKSLGNVKVVTTLTCSDNYQKIVENIVDLNSNRNLQVIIPVDKNVKECTVKTDLLKDDTNLHSKILAYTEDEGMNSVDAMKNQNIVVFVAGILSFIVLIIWVIFYFIRKKSINSHLLLIPLLFIGLGLSYNTAMAGPCTAVNISINDPKPAPKLYQYGETIPLQGSASITYCTDYPSNLQLSFYLDDNKTPFYDRDYYVPTGYSNWYSRNTDSISFGVPSISNTPLAPGEHKIRMDWFQDCTKQGEGTAKGSVTRYFDVAPPAATFRIYPSDLRIRIGEKISYTSYYDSDGKASNPEEEVTNSTSWISSNINVLKTFTLNQFEALTKGVSTITASYLNKSKTAKVTVLADNEPYLKIEAAKNTLIYPETTILTATLIEFDDNGQEVPTEIGDNYDITWSSKDSNTLKVLNVDTGKAEVKGVQNKEGYTQVMAKINKDDKNISGVSQPIQTKYPILRIDPSFIVKNSDLANTQDVEFKAYFDADANTSTQEIDVTSDSASIWSVPSGSSLENLGAGKFRIPAGNLTGNYNISVVRGVFEAASTLSLQGIGTPLTSDITIQLNKDRKIKATATATGGKFPYKYTNWKVLNLNNQPVPLVGDPITSGTGNQSVEFNLAPSVEAPQKLKVQVRVEDNNGAFAEPFKELTYFGISIIQETAP